jgi:hypothetical protein
MRRGRPPSTAIRGSTLSGPATAATAERVPSQAAPGRAMRTSVHRARRVSAPRPGGRRGLQERLAAAGLPETWLAVHRVPGRRNGVWRMPGHATGRGSRCLVGLATGGRGGSGRGQLGELPTGAGAAGGQPGGPGGPVGAGSGGGGGDWDAGDLRGAGAGGAVRGRAGQPGAERGLAAGGGEAEQNRGGDAGAGGEALVAGELGDEPGQVLGAGVVLEEEVGGRGRRPGGALGPAAIAVGAGVLAPGCGAAPLPPPALQGGMAAAGAGGWLRS